MFLWIRGSYKIAVYYVLKMLSRFLHRFVCRFARPNVKPAIDNDKEWLSWLEDLKSQVWKKVPRIQQLVQGAFRVKLTLEVCQ